MEPSRETDALAQSIIGAAIEVHRVLGPGYQENIYEEALAFELARSGIGFERQKAFRVNYKGHVVGDGRVDLLIEGLVVVELKAIERLQPVHKAQVISYLKAAACQIGLLINFNESLLRSGIQRVIYSGESWRHGALAAN
jgi:GxxExxY protein